MTKLISAFLGALICLLPALAHAHRVALIFGNDQYLPQIGSLTNATLDAELIGDTAKEIGFTDVRVVLNADRRRMQSELESFYDRAARAEVAFFYFAGHGFTVAPKPNDPPETGYTGFFTPTDWQGDTGSGIPIANAILGAQRATRIIVIIDACRSTFVARPGQINVIESNLSNQILMSMYGLRPMSRERLYFIASTSNGADAYDGPPGANSAFAGELAKLMREHGARQRGFGDRLRDAVSARSANVQVPFATSNMPDVGNPFSSDDVPQSNSRYLRPPTLVASLKVPGADDAVVNTQGRTLVLHDGRVSDEAGHNVIRAGVLAISPDGSKVVTLEGRDLRSRATRGSWASPKKTISERVTSAAVGNGGQYLVGLQGGKVAGYNELTGGFWPPPVTQDQVTTVAVTPRQRFAYYTTGGYSQSQVCLYDINMLQTAWCRRSGTTTLRHVAHNPSTETFATLSTSGRVQLRTTHSGVIITEVGQPNAWNTCVDFSADGRFIVLGDGDGKISILSAESTLTLATLPRFPSVPIEAHFSSDGSRVVVTGQDGTVQVWAFPAT